MRAQAVVIDALFLLMLCSLAAGMLLWASSVYGNNSFKAYYYMYMGEYNSGILNCLSELEYEDPVHPDNTYIWMDEVGKYMMGEFNKEITPGVPDPRYAEMNKQWQSFCMQMPHPVQLVVYTLDTGITPIRGAPTDPVFFNCTLNVMDPDAEASGGEDIGDFVENYKTESCPVAKPVCRPPPPYFSSGTQRKPCGQISCIVEAKIYY